MFYLIVVVAVLVLTGGGNAIPALSGGPTAALLAAGRVFFWAAAVFALDGAEAFLLRRLPERWFAPLSPVFAVGKREKRFYRRIGVPLWEGKIPELGGFTAFHKNRLSSPEDPAYLARFLTETNYGVLIHLVNGLTGWLVLLVPFCQAPSVYVPVAFCNMVLSFLPLFILRNNTRPLRALYRRRMAPAKAVPQP